jgi:hypothetical protein
MAENKNIKYKIKRKHLFQLSSMYDEMGINIDIDKISNDGEQAQTQVGILLIQNILKNLHKAEDSSNKLLSDITNIELSEIEEMEANKYIELWEGILKDNTLKRFFNKALK